MRRLRYKWLKELSIWHYNPCRFWPPVVTRFTGDLPGCIKAMLQPPQLYLLQSIVSKTRFSERKWFSLSTIIPFAHDCFPFITAWPKCQYVVKQTGTSEPLSNLIKFFQLNAHGRHSEFLNLICTTFLKKTSFLYTQLRWSIRILAKRNLEPNLTKGNAGRRKLKRKQLFKISLW